MTKQELEHFKGRSKDSDKEQLKNILGLYQCLIGFLI